MTAYSSVYTQGNKGVPADAWATQQWGCDFGGSITIGAMAEGTDSGAHNGINFKNVFSGTDGHGYNLTTNLATAFDCAGKSYSMQTLYILTGNNVATVLANDYAVSTMQQVAGPAALGIVNSYKNNIKDRYTSPGYAGGQPQMHLYIVRGGNEASQPTTVSRQYIEFFFKLPADLLAMLSHSGDVDANWSAIWEEKTGFQYFYQGGYYYYGFGDYRVGFQVLQSAGALLYRASGDNNANGQTAVFDGSITGTNLTVTSWTSGTILPGMKITKAGITVGTKIVSQTSKTGSYWGGPGVYVVDTSHGGTGALTGIAGADPTTVSTTFWYYDSSTVELNKWIKAQIYIERPTNQAATSEGRTWIALTPDGGTRTIICDQVGQASSKFQCGYQNNPQSRYFMSACYSGGGYPGYVTGDPLAEQITGEICGLKVYDDYPYAASPP